MKEKETPKPISVTIINQDKLARVCGAFSGKVNVSEADAKKLFLDISLLHLLSDIGLVQFKDGSFSRPNGKPISIPLESEDSLRLSEFCEEQNLWHFARGAIVEEEGELQISNAEWPPSLQGYKSLLASFNELKGEGLAPARLEFANPNKKLFSAIKHHYTGIVLKDKPPEILLKQQEKNRIDGEMAELFAMKFEKNRLDANRLALPILHVAKRDYSAGFDIASFNSDDAKQYDRFIEVKSYSYIKRFYWSRGEIEAAKKYRENYYLYLINRNRIDEAGYVPEIIQNPQVNVFENPHWLITGDGIQAQWIDDV